LFCIGIGVRVISKPVGRASRLRGCCLSACTFKSLNGICFTVLASFLVSDPVHPEPVS